QRLRHRLVEGGTRVVVVDLFGAVSREQVMEVQRQRRVAVAGGAAAPRDLLVLQVPVLGDAVEEQVHAPPLGLRGAVRGRERGKAYRDGRRVRRVGRLHAVHEQPLQR